MIKGYARVSSKEQNLARQIKALEEAGCEKIYCDKQSGKDFERAQYVEMMNNLTNDDVVIIMSIDRLGRNYNEIWEQWRAITKTVKAKIKVLDMPLLDTTQSHADNLTDEFIADLTLQILSYVANLEREHIKERQAEGIAIAKAQGKYKGGKAKQIDKSLFEEQYSKYIAGEITKVAFAENLGVSRPTLDKLLNEREVLNG